jgi:hypothetical protein
MTAKRTVKKSRAQLYAEVKALVEMAPGLRGMAQRAVDAEERFLEYAMLHGRLDRAQARAAMAAFRKARVIKFDSVGGTFHVTHGGFLEPDVLRRAAGLDE